MGRPTARVGGAPAGPDPSRWSPGVVLKGFGQTGFSSKVRTVTFKSVPAAYKPGIPFQGKVAGPAQVFRPAGLSGTQTLLPLAGEDGGPGPQARGGRGRARVRRKLPECDADDGRQGNGELLLRHGALEGHGAPEGGPPPLNASARSTNEICVCFGQARSRKEEEHEPYQPNLRRPEYLSASHHAAAFYSKSRSFLKLAQANGKLSCNPEAAVKVQYIIQGEELKEGQEVLDCFYLVRFW